MIAPRHTTEELAQIGMLAGLHFVLSFAAQLGDSLLLAMLGPLAVFISGVAQEGLTCFLRGVVVVLFPKPATLAYESLTVFLLNTVVGGALGVLPLILVAVSVLLSEITLALTGITTTRWLREPRPRPTAAHVVVVAALLGGIELVKYYVQFDVYTRYYELRFDAWYVHGVAVITGLVYGGLGAAVGVVFAFRLRRTMR